MPIDLHKPWPLATTRIWLSVVILTSAPVGTGAQVVSQEQQAIQRFLSTQCRNAGPPAGGGSFMEVKFAPVRPLADDERPRFGTWGYDYETREERYANNAYALDSGDNVIHLVSILRASAPDDSLPPYLWHVISVPTPADRRLGYMARYREFEEGEEDVWTRSQYRNLTESMSVTERGDTILSYITSGLDESVEADITSIWRDMFQEAMQDLVLNHVRLASPIYTHTFIYQDMPNDISQINSVAGDRRNSSRVVLTEGKAFGFVLNHTGRCLASTTLDVLPRAHIR